MSALGQKQTCAAQKLMSALPPIATSIAFFGMSALDQKRTCRFNGGRVQPMLARSNECCRHFLSEDLHVCGHAVRRARLPKETYNTPVPVPDRQEMGSSNRQSSRKSLGHRLIGFSPQRDLLSERELPTVLDCTQETGGPRQAERRLGPGQPPRSRNDASAASRRRNPKHRLR